MADSTIGGLPSSASLPVAGTDLFALFQGGTTKKVQNSDIRRSFDTFYVSDDFFNGSNSSGSIGQLRWGFSGTGSSLGGIPDEAGRPGILRVITTTVTGVNITNPDAPLFISDLWDMYFFVRLPVLTSRQVRFGLFERNSSLTSNPPADGMYFEYINGTDSNWFGVTRSAAAQTRVDSGVLVVANAWHKLRMRRVDSGTIGFTVDSAAEVFSTTNLFTATNTAIPTQQIASLSGSVNYNIDYFDLLVTGLSR
jgi:hypothetical protein